MDIEMVDVVSDPIQALRSIASLFEGKSINQMAADGKMDILLFCVGTARQALGIDVDESYTAGVTRQLKEL